MLKISLLCLRMSKINVVLPEEVAPARIQVMGLYNFVIVSPASISIWTRWLPVGFSNKSDTFWQERKVFLSAYFTRFRRDYGPMVFNESLALKSRYKETVPPTADKYIKKTIWVIPARSLTKK